MLANIYGCFSEGPEDLTILVRLSLGFYSFREFAWACGPPAPVIQIAVCHDLLLLFGHNLEVMQTTNAARQPLLIYDGDCAFCIYWARYWKRLTRDRVTYAPYQKVAAQYPEIPLAAFQRAVQYIAPDGKIASGAEAAFLTLSHAIGGFWVTLYRHVPGFAAIAERMYAFIASHRSALYRPSLWLWGRDYEPPRFGLVSWRFLRAIAARGESRERIEGSPEWIGSTTMWRPRKCECARPYAQPAWNCPVVWTGKRSSRARTRVDSHAPLSGSF